MAFPHPHRSFWMIMEWSGLEVIKNTMSRPTANFLDQLMHARRSKWTMTWSCRTSRNWTFKQGKGSPMWPPFLVEPNLPSSLPYLFGSTKTALSCSVVHSAPIKTQAHRFSYVPALSLSLTTWIPYIFHSQLPFTVDESADVSFLVRFVFLLQECMQDLMDGFFPSELQERFPNGVPFQVRTVNPCSFHH